MDNRVPKDTGKNLVRNPEIPNSNHYSPQGVKDKTSHNHGKVPFGSYVNHQDWEGSRKMSLNQNTYHTPDPGQYQTIGVSARLSPKGANNPPGRGLKKSGSGTNFSLADLSQNNSGVRMMPTNGQHVQKQKIEKHPNQNKIELSAAVLSLKQKGQVKAAESQRSFDINNIVNANPQSFGRNDSGQLHPFSQILNDKSITNLMDASIFTKTDRNSPQGQQMVRIKTGFNIPPTESNFSPAQPHVVDQSPRVRNIPRGNATSANKILLKNNSSKALLAGSSSLGRIGEVELGSMGLPREVSMKQQAMNYLFNPGLLHNVGPGQHNPNTDYIKNTNHGASISKAPQPTRMQAAANKEANIQNMLKAVVPHRAVDPMPKGPSNGAQTFAQREAKKQSATFAARGPRTDWATMQETGEPALYDAGDAAIRQKDKKNFSLQMPQHHKAIRNTEGAFMRSEPQAVFYHQKSKSVLPEMGMPLVSPAMNTERAQSMLKKGPAPGGKAPQSVLDHAPPNMSNNPELMMAQAEINKSVLKRHMATDEVPGPGYYDSNMPFKPRQRDFPDLSVQESKRFLNEQIDENFLAELQGRRPAPGFNSGVIRFDFLEKERQNNNKTVNLDQQKYKPVIELQQLEGPQTRIARQMGEISGQETYTPAKPVVVRGSAFRQYELPKKANSPQPMSIQNTPNYNPTMNQMTDNAEINIYNNQNRRDQINYYKKELKGYMAQEEQLIAFNGSSPRFAKDNSHQVRLVPGKDSISGVNFRMRADKNLGPGDYESPREIEQRAYAKKMIQNAEATKKSKQAFGFAAGRERGDFQSAAIAQLSYGNHVTPGSYDTLGPLQKKSYNVNLYDKTADPSGAFGHNTAAPKPKFNLQTLRPPKPPKRGYLQYTPKVQSPQ